MLANFHKNVNKQRDALFVLQAGCINIVGIATVLAGTYPPLVAVMIAAQGVYLIIDAHRLVSRDK